jgi:hypothetical protein
MHQHPGPSRQRTHCEGKGAAATSDTPNDDKPGFVAEKPEHYFACYRLIRPGQTYYLTIEGIVHCEDCALSEGVIRVREDLEVEIGRDRLLLQRDKARLAVFPGELRHLVNALEEAAARLVDQKAQER